VSRERAATPATPTDPEATRHHDPVAYTLLVIMAACFAGTWVAAHWATEEVPVLVTAFWRFAVATVLLWAWARLSRIRLAIGRRDLPLVAVMALTGIVAYNLCFLYGVQLAPSSDGAIIVPGLSPIVVAVLVAIRYRVVPARRGLAGLGLALLGLVLVIGPAATTTPQRALGDLLFVLGAVCWGAYSVLSRAATTRFHPVVATLGPAAIGALAFLPLSLLDDGWASMGEATPRALASLLYLGAIGTVVAFVAFSEGIRRIGAARASAFIVLVPLLGVVLTSSLLGEEASAFLVVGTAIVLAGLWLVQTARPRPLRAPAGAITT
jgi:drug/metabolite transporter (DMT)-like permease